MSNLLKINLINKKLILNSQISGIRYFTKKATKTKYVESNANFSNLNKTCYNYDNLLNINNNKNNNLNQYSTNDITPTHVLNTDYHTLMALKHASCGVINIDNFYKLKNEKK